MSDAYETFRDRVREIGQLGATAALLSWDAETTMPPKGLATRAEQLSLLAALTHDRLTDPALGKLLDELAHRDDDPIVVTNVREMRREYDRAVKVPRALVQRLAEVSTIAKDAWAKAREQSAFEVFAPHLDQLLDLNRQVADAVGYEGEQYDALLDEYEPGATAAELTALFASLRGPLSELVRTLGEAACKPDATILSRCYPVEAQKLWCRQTAELMGFDFAAGRLDVSTHPFCSGTCSDDVRLTTRYDENHFSSAVFGTMHEAGHGLYEQGLPAEHAFTPAGQAVSLGIHESQSRLWENMVGRSRAYWDRFYEQCRVAFPEALSDVSVDAFYGAINVVQPSMIRVEADEVTYNLHIILRFEIERGLVSGKLAVEDVPDAWNAKMQSLLGITPARDAEGCLQDIHWSMGAFGYFPTYTLGNLYAAQFYSAAEQELGDLTDQIRGGDFRGLRGWLRSNVHQHGQCYRATELVERITSGPLSIEPFMAYLRGKFLPVYGLA